MCVMPLTPTTRPVAVRSLLSIVVPLYNEESNVAPLIAAVQHALVELPAWELILVDDGSADCTASVAEAIAMEDRRVRLVRLARNYGQSAAMQAGFDQAAGGIVISMDGDLQNDPRDIPHLLTKLGEGYDLVAGYRADRKDPVITRKAPSWVANRVIRWTFSVPIRDTGCSLRAYRRELLDRLHLYSDLHRFIPIVAAVTTGARVTEVPVRHHLRRNGTSKYGLSRIGKVPVDLLMIRMIRSFRHRPLLMFAIGSLAAMFVSFSFAFAAFASSLEAPATSAVYVLPAAALLWLSLACYLLLLGFVGEVALREVGQGQRAASSILWEQRP